MAQSNYDAYFSRFWNRVQSSHANNSTGAALRRPIRMPTAPKLSFHVPQINLQSIKKGSTITR